jgi:hypothetical protein
MPSSEPASSSGDLRTSIAHYEQGPAVAERR